MYQQNDGLCENEGFPRDSGSVLGCRDSTCTIQMVIFNWPVETSLFSVGKGKRLMSQPEALLDENFYGTIAVVGLVAFFSFLY